MTWPEAVVASTLIASIALVVAVAVWQVMKTGQVAVEKGDGSMEQIERIDRRLTQLERRPTGQS